MQASTPVLTPRTRLLRACLKWLLVALVSVWTVVASVYLLIHAVIVPRIDTWRSQAQQQLSSALGAPVRIGSLSGKANNWTSYFEMRDVVVGSNAQAPDLMIPKLEASLSMRGLWRLSFDQVRITSPSVQVQRTASGAWRVAGVALPSGPAQATPFWLDWLFEQPELLVLDGQAAVRDDWAVQAAPATWSFRNIDVALRSGTTSHDARIDFTPPPEWGQRVSVQAQFESPLFSSHGGDWREWSGQAYAQWPQLDAAVIHRALDRFWPTLSRTLSLDAGEMAWRGWLEWRRGMQLQALTSDVALTGVSGAWLQGQPELKPLRFKELLARLSLTNNVQTQQWELGVSDMSFETQDGVTWRDAQLALAWPKSAQDPNAQGRVRVAGVDLTALRQIMPSLPLPQVVRDYLQGWRPQGFVNRFQADWRGALDSTTPLSWHTSGQATQLGWSEGVLAHDPADTAGHGALARPGVSGLSLTWDGTAEGGTAQLSMDKGAWVLPGVWLEPRLDVNSMQAALSWAAPRQALDAAPAPASWAHTDWQALWRVSFDDLRLDTPDGVVSGAGVWAVDPEQVHTDAAGYLRLSAKVDELALPKLGRYLPVSMNADAVSFVRQRLQAGVLRNVSVRINSLLDQSLWLGGDKRFAVEAQAQGVALDYAGGWGADQRWPALATLSGAFAMRGLDIDVSNIKGRLRDATSVVISDASVSLRHLDQDAQLKVQARAAGPLATWLAQLNTTPVQRWTNGLMRDWVGDGDARLNLSLAVPLATPERTTVQGEVTLAGNRVQLWPGVPALQQTQARVRFTDTAVSVDQASAQWLGGPIKGQMQWAASGAAGQPGELRVDVSGNLNANALARTPSLGTVAMLAQRASGSTPFDVSVRGTPHGIGWRFNAPLDGVRLDLPAPLNKPSGQSWPLSVALRPLLPGERSPNMAFGHDIQLRVGPTASPIVSAHFVREYDQALTHITNQTVPSAVRGVVGLGQFDSDALSLPSEGVVADVRLAHFNMDSWRQALAGPATHTAG
ncbi:MAG: hypothetical protein NWS83_04475, partial [Burkholderiaceae bacterium]|nr:hypothetical protein [Burkholderiaceae bacterium]